jgi:cytochrome c-type biogenesis protein CcmH
MKWIILIVLCVSGPAWAGEARPLADDPAAEARLKHLAVELRCLVCQNQTLADSNAPLAEDLRRDFVLYRPPLKATTTLLWVGPFVLLTIGATALVITLRRRAHKVVDAVVSEEEHRKVEQLMAEGGKRS